jgi:tape measure domain-containing protein
MATNVLGGGLEFDVSINENGIEQALAKINQELTDTYNKQKAAQDTAIKQQKEYANVILSTGTAFKSLDAGTQSALKTLANLNVQYRQIADARNTLDQRFNNGTIGAATYSGSLAALMAKENELKAAIQKTTDTLAQNDKLMQSANGSITQKMALLDQLKQKYNNLSEVDRNNTSVSTPILSNIQSLDSEIRNIQNSFNAVEQHALGSINERTAALAKLKNEYIALSEIDRNSDAGKGMLANIQAVDAEVQKLNSSFTAIQQNAAGSINEKVAQLQKLRAEYAALSETDRKNSTIGGAMLNNIRQLDNEVKKLNTDFSKTNTIASQVAIAIGSYLTLNAATDFIKQLVNVRGEFEQLSVAFTTMLGNKEKADKLMRQAVQLAATTPFSLRDVATGAKQLLAYGTAAEKIPDTLKMLGNVASGVSVPLSDIVYLYGTLQTQGRAYTRDILQFTSRGIPLIDALAKQFGVTTGQVQELVEAGKVGFPEVQKALQGMTSQGGMFFNLMEQQSHTVTGMISNLGDAFDKMLNDIGQSNEGIIKDSISGLTTLVSHYQDVIDIIEVLAATYGTYKAAIITTTAVTAIAEEVTAGFTAAEILRARAIAISNTAMKLLNSTMLANPYVAVATGIAALVAAFVVLHREATEVKTSQELLADAQQDFGDKLAATEAKIRPYVEALKGANVSEKERLDIYNKLKAVDPAIVEGLNAKTISYDALTKNVNKYLDALRNQLALESNSNAIKASIQQEQAIQKQITDLKKLQKAREEANKIGGNNIATNAQSDATASQIKTLTAQLEEQRAVSKSLGEAQVDLGTQTDAATASQKRTVEVIDAQISELKKQQVAVSATSAEWKKYQAQIDALQKERESIAGKSQQELKAEQSEENKINTILNERQGILEKLATLQRDSKQSGLSQDASAVDQIRQKYDEALNSVDKYNKKIDEFNKKNGTKVKGIGLTDIDALKSAEQTEILNTIYKQDAQHYLDGVALKKQAFDDFEQIQKQGNETATQQAKSAYHDQIGEFNSFLDYLKDQANKLKVSIALQPDNIGTQQALLEVNKQITEETQKQKSGGS